jgi:hypothetical protein
VFFAAIPTLAAKPEAHAINEPWQWRQTGNVNTQPGILGGQALKTPSPARQSCPATPALARTLQSVDIESLFKAATLSFAKQTG